MVPGGILSFDRRRRWCADREISVEELGTLRCEVLGAGRLLRGLIFV